VEDGQVSEIEHHNLDVLCWAAQEDARKERGGGNREMRRLERLQRALPHLGQRDVILEHLEGLGQVIVLPSDFREQRRSLEHRRNEAANRNQTAMAGLRAIQEKKEAISLNQDILHYTDEIGQQKNEMAKMDGSSRAAELADSSQQVTAKIRRLAERYIRLKLSMRILLDVIEKYRAENQDPVLEIASRFFLKRSPWNLSVGSVRIWTIWERPFSLGFGRMNPG